MPLPGWSAGRLRPAAQGEAGEVARAPVGPEARPGAGEAPARQAGSRQGSAQGGRETKGAADAKIAAREGRAAVRTDQLFLSSRVGNCSSHVGNCSSHVGNQVRLALEIQAR